MSEHAPVPAVNSQTTETPHANPNPEASDPLHVPAVEVVQAVAEGQSDGAKHRLEAEEHPEGEHEHHHQKEEGSGIEDSSDNSSLFEDEDLVEEALDGLGNGKTLKDNPDAFTREEAKELRKELREIRPRLFIEKYLESGMYTAKKLITAFGIFPPEFLGDQPDDAYYGLLNIGISRELSKRYKLTEYNTVQDAVELIRASKNIIVITGAGISTSLGIPDFRSKDTGLYSRLAHLGLDDPQEVFDISIFRDDPSIFYSIAKDIVPSLTKFSPTHAFLALLQEKDKLLTNYSQNIDNIEAMAGVRPEQLIQCHGSFATATCQNNTCGYKVDGNELLPVIREGKIPKCARCIQRLHLSETENPNKRKGSRSHSRSRKNGERKEFSDSSEEEDGNDDIEEPGVMKPDITFFGEALPDHFFERFTNHDVELVDLVIVIGTSLKVAPVSEIPRAVNSKIPQIYISRMPVNHVDFDITLLGECDVVVAELCKQLGWPLEHEMVDPSRQIHIKGEEGGCEWEFEIVGGAEKDAEVEAGVGARDTTLPASSSAPTEVTTAMDTPATDPFVPLQ